jgi:cyclopropane fatty-acyl-phospholipid synthase-like methyltransferase
MTEMESPNLRDFYNRYYLATATSKAYAAFCERVFGANYAQHGFSDMAQVDSLLAFLNLRPGDRVLDLGCGNGGIAAYIASQTGAFVTGIDYVPEAIRQAQARTREVTRRLVFRVMDIGRLDYPPGSFDALISIDTLYFTDLPDTVRQMKSVLKPGGQMGIFFSHGVSPGNPAETFDYESLHPNQTPLAAALSKHGMRYKVWDYTAEDYAHALLKKKVAEDLKAELEAEGNLFLYRSRYGEAVGVLKAIDADAHRRFLYHVRS